MKTELLLRGTGQSTKPMRMVATAAYIAGGLLVVWSGYIHFHLWLSVGYRHIPTIGPLFLVQSIGGLLVGLLVIGARRVWAAVLGIGYAASTVAGFLLSVNLKGGLFGFPEQWGAPFAHQAFAVELATIVVLLIAGALCLVGSAPLTRAGSTPAGTQSAGA